MNRASRDRPLAGFAICSAVCVVALISAFGQQPFFQSVGLESREAFLAEVLISEGKLDEADALIRRSVELNQQRLGADNPRFGGALKALA